MTGSVIQPLNSYYNRFFFFFFFFEIEIYKTSDSNTWATASISSFVYDKFAFVTNRQSRGKSLKSTCDTTINPDYCLS